MWTANTHQTSLFPRFLFLFQYLIVVHKREDYKQYNIFKLVFSELQRTYNELYAAHETIGLRVLSYIFSDIVYNRTLIGGEKLFTMLKLVLQQMYSSLS